MYNIAFYSMESGSGKSSILQGILRGFLDRGYEIYPVKPISITSDIKCLGTYTIPRSFYEELICGSVHYLPEMVPLLLIPSIYKNDDIILENEKYEVYYCGKYKETIMGREFRIRKKEYNRIIKEALQNCNTPLCLEGTGDVLSSDFEVCLQIIKNINFLIYLVVDISKNHSVDKCKKVIDTFERKGTRVNGVILTKYTDKDNLYCIERYLNANNIPILSKIPLKCKYFGSEISNLHEWIGYVNERLNVIDIIKSNEKGE